ncbi:hypothetical protein [Achromobacter sp. AONIH1]|nr:hypothetical protein [Achromobacter sp. AONIH1]
MADSFATDLMAGVLSVQEAPPEGGFVIGLEYLLRVGATGSPCVLDV